MIPKLEFKLQLFSAANFESPKQAEAWTPTVSHNVGNSMTPAELAPVLVALGCPSEKSLEMASQLNKRAQQLSAQKNKTYEEAMAHLLGLMKQGWAAQEKGISGS